MPIEAIKVFGYLIQAPDPSEPDKKPALKMELQPLSEIKGRWGADKVKAEVRDAFKAAGHNVSTVNWAANPKGIVVYVVPEGFVPNAERARVFKRGIPASKMRSRRTATSRRHAHPRNMVKP